MIKEINLKFLIKIFKHFWWKILIFAVVVAIAVGAYAHFTAVPTYSSNVKFYILNLSMTSEYTTQSLISAAQSLSNDYIEIITGDEMTSYLAGRLKELGYGDISSDAIRGMISSRVSSSSSTFEITVTSTDPDIAFEVANIIANESADIVKNTTKPYLKLDYYRISGYTYDNEGNRVPTYSKIESLDYDSYQILRFPKPAKQNPDGTVTSTAIAAVIAAAVAYIYFMMRRLLENVIRTEENIKDIVSFPIIGSIPTWERSMSATKYSQEDKKQ